MQGMAITLGGWGKLCETQELARRGCGLAGT
jgi:hypothetical protein